MNNKYVAKIIDKINASNKSKNIKLRVRELKSGGYSFYLDLRKNGLCSYDYLNIRFIGRVDTVKDDNENFLLAMAVRDKKEILYIQDSNGFSFKNSFSEADFFVYFDGCIKKKTHKSYESSKKALRKFNENISFKNIDEKFCKKYYEFLTSYLSLNSAKSYFAIFKSILSQAVQDKIILNNPADGVKVKFPNVKREFLNLEELKLLMQVPFLNAEVCNAFLFSCFTGLRISDIIKLKFSDIKEDYIEFKQKKTSQNERIKLSENALCILKEQKKGEFIFDLPTLATIETHLKLWTEKAGIKKHITFHCARHTFATMCLTYDVDIFTVSKLLGHRDLKTTQVYAKLIDKKKDEAIDKLPKF